MSYYINNLFLLALDPVLVLLFLLSMLGRPNRLKLGRKEDM